MCVEGRGGITETDVELYVVTGPFLRVLGVFKYCVRWRSDARVLWFSRQMFGCG